MEGAGVSVVRWKFVNTVDDTEVVLPLNPNEMSSPTNTRSLQFAWTSRESFEGRPRLIDSGITTPTEWTFGGVMKTKAHYDLLLEWAKLAQILRVTDHLGRTFEIIITKFSPVPRRQSALNDWRYTYTMNCLLLKEVTD